MKVILLKDVAKIGRRFEIVVVPDGFALNKLIPKSMAKAATPENIKLLQNLSSKLKQDKEIATEAFSDGLKTLKEVQVPVEVEANAEGRMFQSLKIESIIDAVLKATSVQLEEHQIILDVPIKSLGEHVIKLSSGNAHGELALHVVAKTK